MRVRTLLASSLLAAAGVLLPAAPASACITIYMPVIGSPCNPNPCRWVEEETGVSCP